MFVIVWCIFIFSLMRLPFMTCCLHFLLKCPHALKATPIRGGKVYWNLHGNLYTSMNQCITRNIMKHVYIYIYIVYIQYESIYSRTPNVQWQLHQMICLFNIIRSSTPAGSRHCEKHKQTISLSWFVVGAGTRGHELLTVNTDTELCLLCWLVAKARAWKPPILLERSPPSLPISLSRAYQYDTVHSCSIMFPRPLAIPPCYQLDWILNAWTLAFASKAYSSSTARAACVSLPKSGRSASHKFNSSAFLVLLNVTCVFIPPRAVLSYFDAITMPFYSSHCV